MSYYWDPRFLRHIDKKLVKCVCEVGARYGDESIILSSTFKNARILSFECNPNTVNICRDKLKKHSNIKFFDSGLGDVETTLPFYSFTETNDGASSLYKRIDYNLTQQYTGHIHINKLSKILKNEEITCVDLLCMDIQGYELNVLKGCDNYLTCINYIIMEEPKEIINTRFLPEGTFSKYIGAPSSSEIKDFMAKNNFIEIERIEENAIEDNVMYKRI